MSDREEEFWRFPLSPEHLALAGKFWRKIDGMEMHYGFACLCLALVYLFLSRHEHDASRDELYADTLRENVRTMLATARRAQGRTRLN